jgi:putative nucleotidyltransferase with HDIG domain
MNDPVGFLNAFAHSLAVMTLYPDEHPLRERALDAAYRELDGLVAPSGQPSFTFLEDEVIYGRELLRDLKSWDFGRRMIAAGIQRLEFERNVSRDEFSGLLDEILARLTLSTVATGESRQMRSLGARFGAVGLQGQGEEAPVDEMEVTTLDLALGDEADAFRWMQAEVQANDRLPITEAVAVVRSLSVAMHGDSQFVLPLLKLKEFDQYTTTHSLNVSVLSLGLAEALGYSPDDTRQIGVAGLLHDIGKTRIPIDVLTKPGRLTADERALMNEHPVDGARIILESEDNLDLAATVAYEHHFMMDGNGYPAMHYSRECALASRLVHVCDVFDALSTKRPYREAWPFAKTIAYLQGRAGTEFDPDMVSAFLQMLREGDARVQVLNEETVIVSGDDQHVAACRCDSNAPARASW